jgi:hypothetical protein
MSGVCGTCGRENIRTLFLVEKIEGKDHFNDLGVDGRIILKWTIKRQDESYAGRHSGIHLEG